MPSARFGQSDDILSSIHHYVVRYIGDSAFSDCSSLESIDISECVFYIGEEAFSGCSSLKNITIPDSIRIVGNAPFSDCDSLENITIPSIFTDFESEDSNDFRYDLISWISPINLTISKGLGTFVGSAFSNCNSLESIIIYDSYDSITTIGSGAFSGCSSLKSVIIPCSVYEIEDEAFSGCSSLESVVISDSVTTIGNKVFKDCNELKWVYIKKSWKDEAIDNIFGTEPPHKIFRTVGEVKLHLQETLNKLNLDSGYCNEVTVLRNSLRSRNTTDDMIIDIIAPAVNDLENLYVSRRKKNYCRLVVDLINTVSSEELTHALKYFQELEEKETLMESEINTLLIAVLLLKNKLFTKDRLPNPDLSIVKEAAQILSKICF